MTEKKTNTLGNEMGDEVTVETFRIEMTQSDYTDMMEEIFNNTGLLSDNQSLIDITEVKQWEDEENLERGVSFTITVGTDNTQMDLLSNYRFLN